MDRGRKMKKRYSKRFRTRQRQIHLFPLAAALCALLFFLNGRGRTFAVGESLPFFHDTAEQTAFKFPDETIQEGESIDTNGQYIGIDDVTFQSNHESSQSETGHMLQDITPEILANMNDVGFLKQNFYLVDSRTALLEGDIEPQEFLSKDFSLDSSVSGPKVLIFHTHSSEAFVDSDMEKDRSEGIWGVGERLKEVLEQDYGIETLHDTGRYDVVDGKNKILGAYERMEPAIREILEQYPSIQVVIDLHRDGLPENVHLVTEIDGKQCARIMFFNGMCRLNKDGVIQSAEGLSNPYLKENLAFSLQLQAAANKFYPNFTRRIYLNAYRYSLHMKPMSLLVEVGSQMNTKEEAQNAMEPLGKILAQVLEGQ